MRLIYKMFFFVLFTVISCEITYSQIGVSINSTGAMADSSAMLDVSSNAHGVLIPRLTTAERNAIPNPANSLLIFNTDFNCLQIYINLVWQNIYCDLGCSGPPTQPVVITGNASPCENATGETYYIAQVPGANSYNWIVPSGSTITAGQGTTGIVVNFGTVSGNIIVSASNNCGTSPDRTFTVILGSAADDAGSITGTASVCGGQTGVAYSVSAITGATGYVWSYTGTGFSIATGANTNSITADFTAGATSGNLTVYGTSACGNGNPSPAYAIAIVTTPSAPTATAASGVGMSAFDANWNSSAGATKYYLDVATDAGFTAFVPGYNNLDVGNVLTYNVSGLTCNTTYYYRVRANNACGTSTSSNTISQLTSACCKANLFGDAVTEQAYAIAYTSDGGFILAGRKDPSTADIWIIKLDASGTVTWEKMYGGGTGGEIANDIMQTSDGGYIVGGYATSFGAGGYDAWVIKLDVSGNISWQKTYGTANGDICSSIKQLSDNSYIFSGYTYTGASNLQAWVVKLTSAGAISWQKYYGGAGDDDATNIVPTSDGGYIFSGYTNSSGAGNYDYWIVKLDATGAITWQYTYGGSTGELYPRIMQTTDGGYLAVGQGNYGGNYDIWVLKLTSTGTVTWQKRYGGPALEYIGAALQASDGGYTIAAWTQSWGFGGIDWWVFKINSTGDMVWEKAYGGSTGDGTSDIVQTPSGDYGITGWNTSFGTGGSNDFWFMKIDGNGNGPTCSVNTSATITNTAVTPAATAITPVNTAVSAVNSSVTPVSSAAAKTTSCGCP